MKPKRTGRPPKVVNRHDVERTDDDVALNFYARTQLDIAKMLGVSKRMVQKIEERAVRKIVKFVKEEAAASGISEHEWLLGG